MMKAFFLMAGIFLWGISGCKTPANKTTATHTGKLVVSELCNHYVVALETGSIDKNNLAESWTDNKRNMTFKNVFSVASKCSFAKAELAEGDVFSFELTDSTVTENCAICMAYYPTPEQKLMIKNIRKITKP
ncbi:hypothetical protein [Flavihumibacter sp. ZG627]|uniref:hypothetical protein n=1 Tax=Flavihumibacter sp. ZG627 TaxID=1463156 RepID=UPI00057C75F9|nr:hypothetical protein [Flavihumibacter sp. ZG627]KIC90373.1 hypothetical protein HY58_10440 [Flavihumibacter sp. ZG627]